MEVLRRRWQGERIDGDVGVTKPDLEIAAPEQRREFSVAMTQIEDDRERVVLLSMGHEEVDEEALPSARGAQHQRLADILGVQVERIRDVMGRFKDGQRLSTQVRTDACSRIDREQEAQVGEVGLQQRQPAQIVGAVTGHDAEPRVQEVVGFLEQTAVVDRHRFHRFGGLVLQRALVRPVKHERQRTVSEEVTVDFQFRQRLADLSHGGVGGVVHEHVVRSGIRRDIVHHRDALVEEVSASRLEIAAHPIARDALPFQTGDELAGYGVKVGQQMGKRVTRRPLHRQHVHELVADRQVIAVAVDRRVRDEVIQVRVMGERRRGYRRQVVVDEAAEESEGVGFPKPFKAEVAQLHLDGFGLVMECPNRPIEFRFDEGERLAGGQPAAHRVLRGTPEVPKGRARAGAGRRLVQHDHIRRDFVEV